MRQYARMLAEDPARFAGDGSDTSHPPHYQHPVWGSEGGSVYNVTPPQHMRAVRHLAQAAAAAADSAVALASDGGEALRQTRDVMEGVRLLAVYYEAKIAATSLRSWDDVTADFVDLLSD